MPYKPEDGEVFYCAKCRRQYPANDQNRCPVHPQTRLVSWYTKREQESSVKARWEAINGKA